MDSISEYFETPVYKVKQYRKNQSYHRERNRKDLNGIFQIGLLDPRLDIG